jgi:hypothetical protein
VLDKIINLPKYNNINGVTIIMPNIIKLILKNNKFLKIIFILISFNKRLYKYKYKYLLIYVSAVLTFSKFGIIY